MDSISAIRHSSRPRHCITKGAKHLSQTYFGGCSQTLRTTIKTDLKTGWCARGSSHRQNPKSGRNFLLSHLVQAIDVTSPTGFRTLKKKFGIRSYWL